MQKINFKNLPDTSTPLSAENLNLLQDNIETAINSIELSGGGDEVGTVKMFSGSTAPQGWLICDGSAISRTEYAELFSAIGTTYGSGNGTTTFNIPNIEGRTVVGLDSNDTDFNALGKIGGSKELQEHTHNNRMDTLNNLDQNYGLSSNGVYADRVVIRSNNINSNTLNNQKNIQDTGTGNAGNLQPYIVLNFIIKASATTTTQGQIIDSLDGDSTTDAPSVHAVKEGLNGTVLYNNATGATGNITLNDEIENYSTFKIFYTAPNVYVGIAEFFVISGATYAIDKNRIDQQVAYIYQNKIQISGTSLSNLTNRTYTVTDGTIADNNPISINKIIGYK